MDGVLSLLSELESSPYFEYWLPAALVAGAALVSRLLRLSMWAVLLSACLPLLAVQLDLPLADDLESRHPLVIMGVGWLALIAAGTGLALARALARLVHPGSSSPSVFSVIGLVASTGLVALLFAAPGVLEESLPGWQGTLGILILLFALLSFTVSLARLARAGVLVVFWAGICLVLASEIFLRRLPSELLALDLRDISVDDLSALSGLGAAAAATEPGLVKIAILGGRSRSPGRFGTGGYPEALEQMLNSEGRRFEVRETSIENGGILAMRAALAARVIPLEPDVVIISGWYVDALNFEPGEDRSVEIPFLSVLSESSLYRAVSYMLNGESGRPRRLGLSPENYKAILREMVREVKRAGALPVLFHHSVEASASIPLEQEYEKALRDVAREEKALYSDVSGDLHRRRHDLLFLKGDMPSKAGHETIARVLYRSLVGARESGSAVLASNLDGLPSQPFRGVSFVARAEDLKRELTLKIRSALPEQAYKLLFTVNDRLVAERQPDANGRVRLHLPKDSLSAPAVRVAVRAVPSSVSEEDEVGDTDVCTPVPLEVRTSGAGASPDAAIRVPGSCLQPDSDRIATLMALDPKTGSVIRARSYTAEGLDEMADTMMAIRSGSVVAVSIDKPLPVLPGEALKRALRYVGSERFPEIGEELALVGAAGAPAGSALVKSGKGPQELKVGSERLKRLSNLELEEVLAGDKRIL